MVRRQVFAWVLAGCLAGLLADQSVWVVAGDDTTVGGRVMGDGAPLPGVLVSDGFRVRRTDENGRYCLPIDAQSGRFVFVTTPRGFWTDPFYRTVDAALGNGSVDFELKPVQQPDRFDFVFITDMHLEKPEVGLPKFRASLLEINQLEPRPAFLWAQGDLCLQGGAGQAYLDCLVHTTIPVRNGAGNHEMLLKEPNPRGQFEKLFGPTYYSFDWGPIHCIVLDGNKPIPEEEGWKAVHGAVEGRELAWLEADLGAQPPGKSIVVAVHIPVVSSYPERRTQSPEDAPYWEITNDRPLTDLFARYRVRLVLQGHMHENERTTVQGVEYVESISMAGSWWNSGQGFERGVDGSPRGYRIVSVDGDRISHRFRPSSESFVDQQGEFVGLEHPLPAGQQTSFVFNCYDAPHGSTARARIDNGPWQTMPVYPAVNPDQELMMPHHFQLLADTSGLPPGRQTVEAEVTWPDGTVVREQAHFTLTPN